MGSQPKAKVKMVCSNCGSENCGKDASVRWNVDTQAYEVSGIFDDGWCEDCSCERDPKEVEV